MIEIFLGHHAGIIASSYWALGIAVILSHFWGHAETVYKEK
jgi:hypothetical protein